MQFPRLPKIQVSVIHLHGPEKPEVALPPPPRSARDMERDAWVLDAHTRVKAWRFAALGVTTGALVVAVPVALWALREMATPRSVAESPRQIAALGSGAQAQSPQPVEKNLERQAPAPVSALPVPPAVAPAASAIAGRAGASAAPGPQMPASATAPVRLAVAAASAASAARPASPAAPTPPAPPVLALRPPQAVAKSAPAPQQAAPRTPPTTQPAAELAQKAAAEKDGYFLSDPVIFTAKQPPPSAATLPALAAAPQAPAQPQPKPAQPALKIAGVPVADLVLIEVSPGQVVPFRKGDTLPNGRILRSASPSGQITTD